jgi:UDP-2,3-diacylglucosamine pyrophosphatase LpxH
MANQYLLVSDLHLCDVEDHEDGWKSYKSSKYLFDDEFAELLKKFRSAGDKDDNLTLVLNGDIFDFDLVWSLPESPTFPIGARERRRGLRATEGKSVWKLTRILADHPSFIKNLAKFISLGHKIVYVMGNHDREFHFQKVQQAFRDAIWANIQPEDSCGDLLFEEWFYYVKGELYVEHGQQYDYYTSFRHILAPVTGVDGQEEIALPMGNISNRILMNKMGYFNPHATDYILNMYRYLTHWLRHYAFSRRSLIFSWIFGSFLVLSLMAKTKRGILKAPKGYKEKLTAYRERYQMTDAQLRKLARLQREPIANKLFRMVREFWIDRLTLSLLMIGGSIALALVSVPLWVKLMVPLTCFPLIYFLYESLMQGETVFSAETRVQAYAKSIAALLKVKVVSFGHSHVPRLLPLSPGQTFVDTGTWAPITEKIQSVRDSFGDQEKLTRGYRNYLIAKFDGAQVNMKFDCAEMD